MVLKNFLIDDVLQKVDTKRISLKKGDCSDVYTDKYNLPARTASIQNQGLTCYVPREVATVLKNKISVSANGDFYAFYHDNDFTILQDAYALEGKGLELNKYIGLYIVTVLVKVLKVTYNWANKSGWNKIRREYIPLPVKEEYVDKGIPKNACEAIDFEYIEKYIADLELQELDKVQGYFENVRLEDKLKVVCK